jgi:2-methylcitrate dehydratase PrpD
MGYIPYVDEISALLAMARAGKAQGSLEYIMMLSAVSIVIVIALAMVTQLKGTAVHAYMNSSNQSVSARIANELVGLTNSIT